LNCPNLVFSGLMTIGMLDYSSTPENFKVILYVGIQLSWRLGVMFLCG
jgi:PLP dependent protein